MQTIKIEFTSPISIDNGYKNNPVHEAAKSTMEFFPYEDGAGGEIEWIVNDGEFVEHIGCITEGKVLIDYDGVFELPPQAVKLLRQAGFRVPREFTTDINI